MELSKDSQYYKERWRMAKVSYNLSYGAFYQGELVGFVLNAVDERQGFQTAFNACTGVLPKHRGKKIVKTIYEHAIPILRTHGVERCSLEVITKNQRAVRAYRSVGFDIKKKYKCFRGTLVPSQSEGYEVIEKNYNREMATQILDQHWYSWENQGPSLIGGNFKYFEIVFNGELESYFIMAKESGYVAQLEVISASPEAWGRMLNALSQISSFIKINNIDDRLHSKIISLQNAGLENHLDQFEMEMPI
nr:GNAT family N-acetyltransferase [Allomuricauda taeanensis]